MASKGPFLLKAFYDCVFSTLFTYVQLSIGGSVVTQVVSKCVEIMLLQRIIFAGRK